MVAQITESYADVDIIESDAQVVLLDIKLNGINTIAILKSIRMRYPSLPALLVTGYRQEMEATIRAAMQFDVYTCLYKPLSIQDLLEKLGRLQLVRLRRLMNKK